MGEIMFIYVRGCEGKYRVLLLKNSLTHLFQRGPVAFDMTKVNNTFQSHNSG